MNLAPIILFTYNRPEHTRLTLEYLTKCELADQSKLYVFCDGPKATASDQTVNKILEVRKVLNAKQWTKEIEIIVAEKNKGLYRNVTEGVSHVINLHGKCICIEDDLMISTGFLKFMNEALTKYESNDIVKQVSGFLFPIETEKKQTSFFMSMSNTIGWGTWKRAWDEVDFDAKGYEKLRTDSDQRKKFNLDGTYNYFKMLERQMSDEGYGSWGIIFWWMVFKTKGIVAYPDYSLIQHNDFDHSGQHASDDTYYNHEVWDEAYEVKHFSEQLIHNSTYFNLIKNHLKKRSKYTVSNVLIKIKSLFSTN